MPLPNKTVRSQSVEFLLGEIQLPALPDDTLLSRLEGYLDAFLASPLNDALLSLEASLANDATFADKTSSHLAKGF